MYKIGDIVYSGLFDKHKKKGIIIDFVGVNKYGNAILKILDDGEEEPHCIAENFVQPSTYVPDQNQESEEELDELGDSSEDFSEEKFQEMITRFKVLKKEALQIERAEKEIFKYLNIDLKKVKDPNIQKLYAYELLQYVVNNVSYDNDMMNKKIDFFSKYGNVHIEQTHEIYEALCGDKRAICSGYAETLAYLYKKIGLDSSIALMELDDGYHAAVKTHIGDAIYYDDPTLIRSAIDEGDIPKVKPNHHMLLPETFYDLYECNNTNEKEVSVVDIREVIAMCDGLLQNDSAAKDKDNDGKVL